MNPRIKGWLYGLGAAVIVAMSTGFLQIVVNPAECASWTWLQWRNVIIISVVLGLVAGFTYLAKSPLPPKDKAENKSG